MALYSYRSDRSVEWSSKKKDGSKPEPSILEMLPTLANQKGFTSSAAHHLFLVGLR